MYKDQLDMDVKFYYLVEYELIVYFRSMLEGDKCLMNLCIEKKLNIFCHKHLKNPDKDTYKYRVRQRGCSLTHSARTPPAVHQGITIWVDEIEFEKK